jgi:hypothetical protein
MKWGTAHCIDNKPSTIADYKQKRPGFGLSRAFFVEGGESYGNLLRQIWQLSLENLAIFMVPLATFLGYRQ